MTEDGSFIEMIRDETRNLNKREAFYGGLITGVAMSALSAIALYAATRGPEIGGDTVDDCAEHESSGFPAVVDTDTDPFRIMTIHNEAIDAKNNQAHAESEQAFNDSKDEKKGGIKLNFFFGDGKIKIGELACLNPNSGAMELTTNGMALRAELE